MNANQNMSFVPGRTVTVRLGNEGDDRWAQSAQAVLLCTIASLQDIQFHAAVKDDDGGIMILNHVIETGSRNGISSARGYCKSAVRLDSEHLSAYVTDVNLLRTALKVYGEDIERLPEVAWQRRNHTA